MRYLFALVLMFAIVSPARAQWVVIDSGNLAQAVLIAERTLREYETLMEQYRTIRRMSQRLGDLSGYRMPSPSPTRHDVARWNYGRPWLQTLNSGNPTDDGYANIARLLDRPDALLDRLPAPARRAVEQAYATIEVTDSVARTAGQQVGRIRGYTDRLQQAVQQLEADVVNDAGPYHEMTAILDKVAAGALIGRRQDTASNQLLSHALEQLLIRSKRMRDTEATAMNMRLGGLRDGRTASASVVRGAADDLRAWRQP
jgi:hypothetical protein